MVIELYEITRSLRHLEKLMQQNSTNIEVMHEGTVNVQWLHSLLTMYTYVHCTLKMSGMNLTLHHKTTLFDNRAVVKATFSDDFYYSRTFA